LPAFNRLLVIRVAIDLKFCVSLFKIAAALEKIEITTNN